MERNIQGRDEALQALIDKQEIRDLLMRYCRGIDRCDKELLRSVYHPDATDDHGFFKGSVSEFLDWIMADLVNKYRLTMHSISNILIELEGDVAYGETYLHAYHRIKKEEIDKEYDLVAGGRYIDRFERRNGVWKIASRRCVYDWFRRDPCTERWSSQLRQDARGLRGPDDPVYHRLPPGS